MKTKMALYKLFIAIPLLFSLLASLGCGQDKKSSSRVTGGGGTSGTIYKSGGICYQNGVQVAITLCDQPGTFYLDGSNVCRAWGTNQQVESTKCTNTGSGNIVKKRCNGYFYYPYQGQTIQIYCNGTTNDCFNFVVYEEVVVGQPLVPVQCI